MSGELIQVLEAGVFSKSIGQGLKERSSGQSGVWMQDAEQVRSHTHWAERSLVLCMHRSERGGRGV